MTVRKLTATAARDGRGWLVSIPEVGASAPAANGRDMKGAAAEAAALALGTAATDVDVDVVVHVTDEAEALWREAAHVDAEARERAQHAAALRRRAVRAAREDGYTLDAVGAAFSISHQRVQQLTKPEEATS